jgi:hypothetical protein
MSRRAWWVLTAAFLAQPLLVGTAHAQQAPASVPQIESPGGVPVTVTSRGPSTEIFIAHGDVPAGAVPDPFERVGVAPLDLQLAPGTYTMETASPTASGGHQRFAIEAGAPMTVQVRPGDANVKGIGSVLIGLGVVSVLLGVVAIVSISPDDSHYNRFGIGLPLLLGGAGGACLGVAMTALGSTDIRVRPAGGGGAKHASPIPALAWRF